MAKSRILSRDKSGRWHGPSGAFVKAPRSTPSTWKDSAGRLRGSRGQYLPSASKVPPAPKRRRSESIFIDGRPVKVSSILDRAPSTRRDVPKLTRVEPKKTVTRYRDKDTGRLVPKGTKGARRVTFEQKRVTRPRDPQTGRFLKGGEGFRPLLNWMQEFMDEGFDIEDAGDDYLEGVARLYGMGRR